MLKNVRRLWKNSRKAANAKAEETRAMAAQHLSAAALALAAAVYSAAPATPALYVSTKGNDAWSGRLAAPNRPGTDGPLATLERARDEIRRMKATDGLPAGGLTVELGAGIYELARPFELTNADSGSAAARIAYRARPGAEVRLVGGKVIADWKPVTDPAVLARLDEKARAHVVQADLRAQGVADLGTVAPGPSWGQSAPGLELFFQDRPMTLARWPNEGFAKIQDLLGPTPVDVRGTKGCREGIFTYEGDRPQRWAGETDLMAHGYWFWDWADQRLRIASIDTEKRVITLDPEPKHAFGFRKGQWYTVYNALPELDEPGEWYLDRKSGMLYFWPPAPLAAGTVTVSVLPTLVTLNAASYVSLQGLTLECARGTAVSITGGTETRLSGCVIRNVGGWGARLSAGLANAVVGCDIYAVGDGGVALSGGERRTLTAAGLAVDNCHIHHYGRWNPILKPGVQVDGVGNRMTHNLIDNAPHMAVLFSGNDHVFEYNEIHSVVHGANDAGVMYAGYNPTMRGHLIRYNYIHHIYGYEGRGCVGVYLDDMFCSATISGNIFYQVPRAAFIGGGRDSLVENNVFVDCAPAIHVDARALGWASAGVVNLITRLKEVPYQDEPWRSRFPQLLTYEADEPAVPKGNLFARNVCWGGRWDEVEARVRDQVRFEDNLTEQDPLFVDAAKEDFRLRPESPAWKLGFREIPVDRIGLYASPERASWPVASTVRPAPARPPAAPAAKPQPRHAEALRVPRVGTVPVIDGKVSAAEWSVPALPVRDTPARTPLAGKPATLRLAHDGTTLFVAVSVPLPAGAVLRRGAAWGHDDGAEVCFRDASGAKPGPTFVLHGFAAGQLTSGTEAGASEAAASKLAAAARFAAVIGPEEWTGEWAIPLAGANITPAAGLKLGFNLGIWRSPTDEWLAWAGALGPNFQLDNTGTLLLE